jgi:diketogulonate reductase-like aldo/keto reductase
MNKSSMVELHNGNTMPILGLGTYKLVNNTTDVVKKALELGYSMIDTAGNYGTQRAIGRALAESELARSEYYIVTKVENNDDTYEAAKQNVQELGLDYVDLVLIHWPPEQGTDADLWAGLLRAKAEGIVRDIGVSNYSIENLENLLGSSLEIPVVNQVEWSPFGYDVELLEFCEDNSIVMQAYSPLTRGERLDNPVVESVAEKHNKSPAQVLIRWSIELGIVPLVKSSSSEHLRENIAVFDFSLDREDVQKLASLNESYSALGLRN